MKTFSRIFIVLIILAIVIGFYPIEVLQVFIADEGPRHNEVIVELPVDVGDEFSVRWTHSVSKRPVIETYTITEALQIDTKEMIFDTFSANLPAQPDYQTKWEYHDDYIRVYNFDRTYDELPVVIGAIVANHKLEYKDKLITLKEEYKLGGFVKLRVVKKNIYNYLMGEVF